MWCKVVCVVQMCEVHMTDLEGRISKTCAGKGHTKGLLPECSVEGGL